MQKAEELEEEWLNVTLFSVMEGGRERRNEMAQDIICLHPPDFSSACGRSLILDVIKPCPICGPQLFIGALEAATGRHFVHSFNST